MKLRYFVSVHFVDGTHWELGRATLEEANALAKGIHNVFHKYVTIIKVREIED